MGREYPASGYYKFKTDAANIAAQRQQQQLHQNKTVLDDKQDLHRRDRSKSGDMGTTIDNMYSKYKDKRGGFSARPNPISSSQAIGLKRDLAEQLPRLKGKGSEPRNK